MIKHRIGFASKDPETSVTRTNIIDVTTSGANEEIFSFNLTAWIKAFSAIKDLPNPYFTWSTIRREDHGTEEGDEFAIHYANYSNKLHQVRRAITAEDTAYGLYEAIFGLKPDSTRNKQSFLREPEEVATPHIR